jgi:hypothetical protein
METGLVSILVRRPSRLFLEFWIPSQDSKGIQNECLWDISHKDNARLDCNMKHYWNTDAKGSAQALGRYRPSGKIRGELQPAA